jgi:hypothetical protein
MSDSNTRNANILFVKIAQDITDSASASLVNAQGCGTFDINANGDVSLNGLYQAPTKMALGANMKGQWGLVRGQ